MTRLDCPSLYLERGEFAAQNPKVNFSKKVLTGLCVCPPAVRVIKIVHTTVWTRLVLAIYRFSSWHCHYLKTFPWVSPCKCGKDVVAWCVGEVISYHAYKTDTVSFEERTVHKASDRDLEKCGWSRRYCHAVRVRDQRPCLLTRMVFIHLSLVGCSGSDWNQYSYYGLKCSLSFLRGLFSSHTDMFIEQLRFWDKNIKYELFLLLKMTWHFNSRKIEELTDQA